MELVALLSVRHLKAASRVLSSDALLPDARTQYCSQ